MNHRYAVMGVAASLAIVLVLAGCGSAGQASQASADSAAAGSDRVVNVETLIVQPEAFTEQVTVTGTVEAERDVTISAEESGVIRELYVAKGQRVSAGQPIAKIDDRVLRAQYEQARSEASLAKETYERQRRLWEDEEIGTEIAYLRAKYGAETADANARVLAARLERTVVHAPIAGILEDRMVEIGSMAAPGSAIARVVDIDPLKIEAGVPERYTGDIRQGAEAYVAVEGNRSGEVRGRIRFVGTVVNASNRTFPVEVDVPNTGGTLKPGLIARVRLARRIVETAILVPRDAVLRAESGYIVYVVVDRGGASVAEARTVTTGAGQGGRVLIDSGLDAGDRVVVVGQQQLANGDRIRDAGDATGGTSE
jgi:membrane fusion protein (multidrug efflux system)